MAVEMTAAPQTHVCARAPYVGADLIFVSDGVKRNESETKLCLSQHTLLEWVSDGLGKIHSQY